MLLYCIQTKIVGLMGQLNYKRIIKIILLISLLFFPFIPFFATSQIPDPCQPLEYQIFPDEQYKSKLLNAPFELDFVLQFNNPNSVNYLLNLVTDNLTPTNLSAELLNTNYVVDSGPVEFIPSTWEFTTGVSTIRVTRTIDFIDTQTMNPVLFTDGTNLPYGNYTLKLYPLLASGFPLTFRHDFGDFTAIISKSFWDYENVGGFFKVNNQLMGCKMVSSSSSTSSSSTSSSSTSSSSTSTLSHITTLLPSANFNLEPVFQYFNIDIVPIFLLFSVILIFIIIIIGYKHLRTKLQKQRQQKQVIILLRKEV